MTFATTVPTTVNVNNTPAYPLHSSIANAVASIPDTAKDAAWTIAQDFRKPERYTVAVTLDASSKGDLTAVPEQYRGLLLTVLENAAKTILKRYIESFSVTPSSIPANLLDADSIMSEAVGNNSEWMTKEELVQAWEASATRRRMVTHGAYSGSGMNREYRQAVHAFAEMILKLAGKTSTYQPSELDAMLAKLHADDLDTALGSFIVRRVESLRNKKAPAAVNLDLL